MTEETKLILKKLDALDTKIENVQASLDQRITNVQASLDQRITNVQASLDQRITDVQASLDQRITDVQASLDQRITDLKLTLENVTNKNIQIIAEGHLDLSRKLDEALKVNLEKEMLLLRVNRLENDMRQVKETIDRSA